MFNQDLIKKIKTLQRLQGVGVPRPEWLKSNREILLMQVRNTLGRDECRHTTPFLNRAWQFLDVFLPARAVYYFVRPVMIGCLVVMMVFGGWVTGVSASYNSLPGDVLYPVKIATETVQTSLAPNKKEEIKLRVEFATRRAEEMKIITKSSALGKEKKVAAAVKNLKSNLETVKSGLDEMTKDSPLQVVDVAKAVSAQTTEIEKKLDQSKEAVAADGQTAKDQVKEATVAVTEAGVKAVEVLVAKHAEDKNSVSSAEVTSVVDGRLKTVEDKVAKVEGQLGAVVAAATSTAAGLPTRAETKEAVRAVTAAAEPIKQSTEAAKEAITQAKELMAQDNFVNVVDKLKASAASAQAAENKVDEVASSQAKATEDKKTASDQAASASSTPATPPAPANSATTTFKAETSVTSTTKIEPASTSTKK